MTIRVDKTTRLRNGKDLVHQFRSGCVYVCTSECMSVYAHVCVQKRAVCARYTHADAHAHTHPAAHPILSHCRYVETQGTVFKDVTVVHLSDPTVVRMQTGIRLSLGFSSRPFR